MADETPSQVNVTLDEESAEGLQISEDLLTERDEWNNELTNAEVIRRVLKEYPDLWAQAQQQQAIIGFIQQHHPDVLQQIREEINQEIQGQQAGQQPSREEMEAPEGVDIEELMGGN